MEHSSEPSIAKVLLDYSEYERLRHIEAKYIELSRPSKSITKDNTLDSNLVHQIGKGEENCEISSIHSGAINTQSGAGEEISSTSHLIPPTATHEENVLPSSSSNQIHYNVNVKKNDFNVAFDEERLLTFVPKNYIKTAKFLLKEFDKRGDELTWNSSGVIFIDKISIPKSNIFVLFPLLFKKKAIKQEGLDSFVQKIHDMGLGDLIQIKPLFSKFERNEITGGSETQAIMNKKSEVDPNVPWWYLGD